MVIRSRLGGPEIDLPEGDGVDGSALLPRSRGREGTEVADAERGAEVRVAPPAAAGKGRAGRA
ncbi:hypothetical protein ACIQ9E_03490 [Streptomyces sp. NPDC094448]|uniref:hypothetical protein n=1 Tax=Streptomyces sp. NPDC094448 TaxID=3366063 RepID=UPI003824AE8C